MAEKIFTNIRLGLKVDTLAKWNESSLILKKGEVAFATVAASAGTGLKEPVVMMKIGDGEHTFSQLGFDFYAKASDVLDACKTEDGLTAFVNKVIADAGIASSDAMEALAGRVTTAEGKVTTLEGKMTAVEGKAAANEAAIEALDGKIGEDDVATQIAAAIAELKIAEYAKKTEVEAVQTSLNEYKTANDAAVQKNTADIAGEIARAKAAEEANAAAIEAMKGSNTIDSFGDVEAELAKYQLAGDYATKAEAQAMADGKDAAIAEAKKAGTDAQAAAEAADAKAQAVSELVGESSVADQIATEIADLKLGETYATKGEASAAESNAKSHADGLNTAMDARVKVVEGKAHTHTFVESELNKIAEGDVAKWNAAEQNAKDYADGLDEAMDARVLALEGKFGEGEGNVESQIEAAVAAEAELREAADADLLELIEANDGEIEALQGAVEALEGKMPEGTVAEAIAEAVDAEADARDAAIAAEAEIARAAEKANADAIAAEKERAEGAEAGLQTQINTIMNNPDAEGAINSINEFTTYVTEHGTIAKGMQDAIAANTKAISAEETRAKGVEGGLDTRLQAVEAASATHAAQADLEALSGRVTTAEGKVTTLEGEMDDVEAAVEALEGKMPEGTVAEAIDAAIEALKIGDYAKAADLTAAIEQHNTDKAALEAEIAKKANDADLKAVAKSGLIDDLSIGEGTVLVFDCGSSVE